MKACVLCNQLEWNQCTFEWNKMKRWMNHICCLLCYWEESRMKCVCVCVVFWFCIMSVLYEWRISLSFVVWKKKIGFLPVCCFSKWRKWAKGIVVGNEEWWENERPIFMFRLLTCRVAVLHKRGVVYVLLTN